MPSKAAKIHAQARKRALSLAVLVRDVRLRPLSNDQKRTYLHASLALQVAAWESYIERVIEEVFAELADPLSAKYSTLHSLFQSRYLAYARGFNTPNWENCRQLLTDFTGYDPINDWSWPARQMSGPLLRVRINEILKVRHSFAHGVAMPSFGWNTSSAGEVRLTSAILGDVDACFRNLVAKTDRGLKRHLKASFGIKVSW